MVGKENVVDPAVLDRDPGIRNHRAGQIEGADPLIVSGIADGDIGRSGHVAERHTVDIVHIGDRDVGGIDVGGGIADDEVLALQIEVISVAVEDGPEILRDERFGEVARIDTVVHRGDHDGGPGRIRNGRLGVRERGIALRAEVRVLAVHVVAVHEQRHVFRIVDDQVAVDDLVLGAELAGGVFAAVDEDLGVDGGDGQAGEEDRVAPDEVADHVDDLDIVEVRRGEIRAELDVQHGVVAHPVDDEVRAAGDIDGVEVVDRIGPRRDFAGGDVQRERVVAFHVGRILERVDVRRGRGGHGHRVGAFPDRGRVGVAEFEAVTE